MRSVHRVSVIERPHGLVARELHWRYLFFYWSVGILLVIGYTKSEIGGGALAWDAMALPGVGILLVLALVFRTCHWQLILDADAECWRTELRVPGLFSFAQREWPLAAYQLGAQYNRREKEVKSDGIEGLGCLAALLPFPFNFIVMAAASGKTAEAGSFLELVLIPAPGGQATSQYPVPLVAFESKKTMDHLLSILHTHAPQVVRPDT